MPWFGCCKWKTVVDFKLQHLAAEWGFLVALGFQAPVGFFGFGNPCSSVDDHGDSWTPWTWSWSQGALGQHVDMWWTWTSRWSRICSRVSMVELGPNPNPNLEIRCLGLGSFALGLLPQAKGLNHWTYMQHRRLKPSRNMLEITLWRVGADPTLFLLAVLDDVETNSIWITLQGRSK